MRHGRAKAARKTLQYFGRTIGLKAPYWILMDPTFVAALFQQKILPPIPRIDRVLQTTGAAGPNKYCVTQSAVEELKVIRDGLAAKKHVKAAAFHEALDFIRKECVVLQVKKPSQDQSEGDIAEKPTPQEDLISYIEENERPYIVASQDEYMLSDLRNRGRVPIVRLANNSVLLLEHPSKQSQQQTSGMERKKWKHGLLENEKALVDFVKKETNTRARLHQADGNGKSSTLSQNRQRTKKAKGPNPLSCKRKQRADDEKKESASKKRRNRGSTKKQKTEIEN